MSSLFSLLVGTIVGLTQFRIKRLFAYSTISHVGFMLLALGISSVESTQAFIFYLTQYTISNLNAFIILIAIGFSLYCYTSDNKEYEQLIDKTNSPIQLVSQLKGYFYINPVLALSLAITIFSFVGVPPLVGFFGKQMVLYAATHNGNFFLAFVAILVSVVSAAYYLRIIKVIHFDPVPAPSALSLIKTTEISSDLNVTETNNSLEGSSEELSTSSSLVIATITLLLIFFIINPTPLLNSVHLITLNLF